MLDVAQFLLMVVILILTGLLVAIGFQVVNILKEFKRSIKKINKILDDAGIISGSVAQPMANFSEFFEGVKGGFKIIEWIFDFLRKKGKEKLPKEEEKEENKKEKESEKEKKKEPSRHRRFFTRNGKKLS